MPTGDKNNKPVQSVAICVRGAKGLSFLAAFLRAHTQPVQVFIDGEQNVQRDYLNDLLELCRGHGAPFEIGRPDGFGDDTLVLAAGWCRMIRARHLLVMHDSLLPKYRGFNPLPTALIAGDREIGVTLLRATERVDAGPILSQKRVSIEYPITLQRALDTLGELYAELAVDLAEHLAGRRELIERAQDESQATYSLWRDEQDYTIDWTDSAANIRRFVDAVGLPYSGARATMNGEPVTILAATDLDDVSIANRTPGKVFDIVDDKPIVVCGEGLLRLDVMSGEPLKKRKTRFA